jgi:hypothetical protein
MTQLTPSARTRSFVRIGGSLGIAAACIALAIFLLGLFRFDAAFVLSPLPLILSAIGLILTIVGGFARPHAGDEEVQPLAALFTCAFGLIGGVIELWVWMQ